MVVLSARKRPGSTTRPNLACIPAILLLLESVMSTLLFDLKQAFRSLKRAPGLALALIFSLALGIGANTAAFSALRAALLQPLPWRQSENLVLVTRKDSAYPQLSDRLPVSYPRYRLWKEGQTTLEGLEAYSSEESSIVGPGSTYTIQLGRTTAGFFRVLGAQSRLGRLYGPGEEDAVVLSHRLWMRVFHGDPGAVGRTVRVGITPRIVVGVLGPESTFQSFDAFVPMNPSPAEESMNGNWLFLLGRRRPGVTLSQVQAEFRTLSGALAQTMDSEKGIQAVIRDFREGQFGSFKSQQRLLILVASFVLALALLNVTIILLGRASARRNELGLRQALGAGPGKVHIPLLAEALVCVLPGLALGLIFAWLTRDTMRAFVPEDLQSMQGLSWTEFGFAALLGLLLAFLSAWVPARLFAQINLPQILGGAKSTETPRHLWVRHGLVALQVALALSLISGFMQVAEGLRRLQNIPLGFHPGGRILAPLTLPDLNQQSISRRWQEAGNLLERIQSLPGVKAAGFTDLSPIASGGGFNGNVAVPGHDGGVFASFRSATEGYFKAMGIPLMKGREFVASDIAPDAKVTIVSESFARAAFPGVDPIDKMIGEGAKFRIVGVVGDVNLDEFQQRDHKAAYYMPRRFQRARLDLVVDADGDADGQIRNIRRVIQEIWPDVPVDQISTYEDALSKETRGARSEAENIGLLAALALILTMLGLYGVINRNVLERQKEFGIRLALGASPKSIIRLVLFQGMYVVIVGMILGLAGCFAMARVLSSRLNEVEGSDPRLMLMTAAVLFGTALLACVLPAVRAGRVEPSVALQSE